MKFYVPFIPSIIYLIHILLFIFIVILIISYVRKSWKIDEMRQQNIDMLRKIDEMQLSINEMSKLMHDK